MRKHKSFWDRNAGWYDRFMRKDRAAYDEMYVLIRPVVKAKTVLELATGTGLIAKHIVNAAAHIEATDASPEMIAEAKRDNRSAKLYFSVQDMFCLPYAEESFDVVIVSNALHIVPQPEKATPLWKFFLPPKSVRQSERKTAYCRCTFSHTVSRSASG